MLVNEIRGKEIFGDQHQDDRARGQCSLDFLKPLRPRLDLLVRPSGNAPYTLQRLQVRQQFLKELRVLVAVPDQHTALPPPTQHEFSFSTRQPPTRRRLG